MSGVVSSTRFPIEMVVFVHSEILKDKTSVEVRRKVSFVDGWWLTPCVAGGAVFWIALIFWIF